MKGIDERRLNNVRHFRWDTISGLRGYHKTVEGVTMLRYLHKKIVAEQTLQITVLKDVVEKKL